MTTWNYGIQEGTLREQNPVFTAFVNFADLSVTSEQQFEASTRGHVTNGSVYINSFDPEFFRPLRTTSFLLRYNETLNQLFRPEEVECTRKRSLAGEDYCCAE